jgi:hypothetical protein
MNPNADHIDGRQLIGYRIVKGRLGQVVDEFRFEHYPGCSEREVKCKAQAIVRLLLDDNHCVIPRYRWLPKQQRKHS